MKSFINLYTKIVIIICLLSYETVIAFCPDFCKCDTWYHLKRASCVGCHLYDVDTGVPNYIQALDLSNNSISRLNNLELANIGLNELKYLNLSGNQINDIGLEALTNLNELTVLDLSRNHLYQLLNDFITQNVHLRILKLSKNNFHVHVPKLRSSSLTDLALDNCEIGHIPSDTFDNLNNLRNLDISHNMMIQLNPRIIIQLRSLKQISLTGNPWSCNKLIQDLQYYLIKKNIEFIEFCHTKLRKKFERIMTSNVTRIPNLETTTNNKIVPNPKTELPPVMNKETIIFQKISSYWFFVFGFLLGSVITVIICYVIGLVYIVRRPRRTDPLNVQLLYQFWQNEESPPPTYGEVMARFETDLN